MCNSCNEKADVLEHEYVMSYSRKFALGEWHIPSIMDEDDFREIYQNRGYDELHFMHLSVTESPLIAVMPTPDHARQDRQVRMKLGKYLVRFMPELGETRIRELVEQHNGKYSNIRYHVAKTPRTIQAVYERGPRSCMSHSADDYSSCYHPTVVYGAGDIGVLFIWSISKEHGIKRRITGRAIVHLERKVYGRIYGDESRMELALNKAGYSQASYGDFDGSRLLRIPDGDDFVMPYLDNGYAVDDRGIDSPLIMSRGGSINCEHTNGLTSNYSGYCYRCEDGLHEDDMYFDNDGDCYCEHCYWEEHSYCDSCGETVRSEDTVYMDGHSETWCDGCYENHGGCCEECNSHHAIDDMHIADDDEMLRCSCCHEEHEEQNKEDDEDETTE